MKYEKEKTVNAIYTKNHFQNENIFIEAMPKMLSKDEFFKSIENFPGYIENINSNSPEERRSVLINIYKCFYPMDYMYYIYDVLYRAIIENYSSKSTIESIRQINALHQGRENELEYTTHSYSGAILGVPGIGKTSTIKRSLSVMPQVIVHTNYNGQKLYEKQILYLVVECPSDCSVKTLATSILVAIDKAISSEYSYDIVRNSKESVIGRLIERVKIACLRHHVGVIIIDEIQNAVATATKTKQIKPLIKFLVELTNEACVSTCFCGTLLAEELFQTQEHLKRRTRGLRLLPLKPDITYRDFLTKIWKYQTTLKKTPLTDKLANLIYDYSGGIPAYILKIFVEVQAYAILNGTEEITQEGIKDVAKKLQLDIQKRYLSGTSISDFEINTVNIEEKKEENAEEIISLFAKKRGRPVIKRNSKDLIEIYKGSKEKDSLIEKMKIQNLCEII